jgi:hypothetical protein
MTSAEEQFGFDALLASADRDNECLRQEKLYRHLPGTMDEAVPYFRALIDRHHAAMIDGDGSRVEALRQQADDLALKLNNYDPGILADDDAPGCVLDRLTAAPRGIAPLWGQSGEFEIECDGMRVLIEMDGIYGIGAFGMSWLGFKAHAVDRDRPFLSETGFRSFLGVGGALRPGHTPATFVAEIIARYVKTELKGKLVSIGSEYRQPAAAAAPATADGDHDDEHEQHQHDDDGHEDGAGDDRRRS